MEIESSPESISTSTRDNILQNLLRLGVPEEDLNQGHSGLVAYLKKNRSCLPDLAYAILPNPEWKDDENVPNPEWKDDENVYHESLSWLQWLMFECDPNEALEQLCKLGGNERGVCGTVWGSNDIAYRCRTCEHDPTCAICVPCFESGNHKEHDYSVIYTGGGCCDCGDVTAWKREGFCSKHRGAEQIQPLPENFAMSLGPVLDLLLSCWKEKLHCAKRVSKESPRTSDHIAELQKAADKLTSAAVEMLLYFCMHSESLLSFISGRVHSTVGLLDALFWAESFMTVSVVGKLHELLLKLLGEPIFKYEFAKIFVSSYPKIVDEAIKEHSDTVLKKHPLLSTFSVQILTVPTLTPRLVKERNLMAMLLQSLENIFIACGRGDGRLEAYSKRIFDDPLIDPSYTYISRLLDMTIVVVPMAKPSMIRAEQPLPLDLTAGRTGLHVGAPSRRKDIVFIVNPQGAKGRTGKEWRKLLPFLRSRLGSECNICESLTSGPFHATDITREAIREGADAVVAVGGDGTLHEVVNGFFWEGKHVLNNDLTDVHRTALGLIPLGTGSDFARTLGWKCDPQDSVERIGKGIRSHIDVGVISGDSVEPHYFINVADAHLSAKAGYYASRYKRFGNLCYVIGTLQAFFGHQNKDLRVKIDDGDWEEFSQVTSLCVGNAKYFGGGMKITPNANPSSGDFEIVILKDFKWYDFVFKLHMLYNGTHLSVNNVCGRRARSIEVEDIGSGGNVFVQSDGEYLGFLPRKFSILPSAIEMIC